MKPLHVILLLSILFGCSTAGNQQLVPEPAGENNMAYRWAQVALECTANDTERFRPRPTVTSRMLGLIWTAAFDAWSVYTPNAIPFYLTKVDRKSVDEQTLINKEKAISHALFRTMMEFYFSDSLLLRSRMKEFGFDPDNTSIDPQTPEGVGNLAAQTVINARLNDGANQRGDMPGSDGKSYSDYTGYSPVNSVDNLTDVIRWQPKYFSDGQGGRFAPGCLTPHWGKVSPLTLDSASQFRPGPPPAIGSDQLNKEIEEVVSMQASLTDEQRALVEFMRDGPQSVQQAGHWLIFAREVSLKYQHTLDDDVQMYFLVEAAAMDAFIACWDSKMFYDYARPYTLVHDYYQDRLIKAWAGPEKGMVQIKGIEWRPYSPDTFLCPPFPSYVSGHSTVSGACAEVLKLFTGSDNFGESVKLVPGSATEPNRVGDTVTLVLPTFTQAANMAGMSRVLGGYHIQSDNTEGLALGRNVAQAVWKKYSAHTGR
jgi:hypothetical protein